MDKARINDFWLGRTKIEDDRLATNYRDDGRLEYDLDFIKSRMVENARILDLGAGTCTLSSRLIDQTARIVAVEKFEGFLSRAPSHPKLIKVCSDILPFDTDERFDLVLVFGVVNFIEPEEEVVLYAHCHRFLRPDGLLIVKNQCGLKDEVEIDTYSQELSSHYHARYPKASDQLRRLEQLFDVEQHDIYPAELNRWHNTHFFAFVARRRGALPR